MDSRKLFWIFDYSFWLFDYSFSLFDDRVKYIKFLLAVEVWFLLLKIIFVTPNKVLNIAINVDIEYLNISNEQRLQ